MCGIVGAYHLKNKIDDSFISQYVEENKYKGNIPNLALRIIRLIEGNKNRGSDGFGIATYSDNNQLELFRFQEINSNIKKEIDVIKNNEVIAGLGHSRYQTSGGNQNIECLQPMVNRDKINILNKDREFSFVFNGNIENSDAIKKRLEEKWKKEGKKYKFKLDGLDTEVLKFMIIDLFDEGKTDLRNVIELIYKEISGSCNIGILKNNGDMAIATDPHGFRPLTWGIKNGVFMFSSEEQALFARGINKTNHLGAGKIIEIKNGHFYGEQNLNGEINHTPCVFELIYFGDPRSTLPNGDPISRVRYSLGQELAENETLEIEGNEDDYVVMGIPASADDSTEGYANYLGLKNVKGIIKKPKAGRTFISDGKSREDKINKKYEFTLKEYIKGKKLILTDDSIVRGATMGNLIERIKREFEPSEIHIRIPAPAIIGHCPYGLDMHTRKELFAPKYSEKKLFDFEQIELDKMAKDLGVDSLSYLTVASLKIKMEQIDFSNACMGCLNGTYPTKLGQEVFDEQLNNIQGDSLILDMARNKNDTQKKY